VQRVHERGSGGQRGAGPRRWRMSPAHRREAGAPTRI
jgi:hypothetical protein